MSETPEATIIIVTYNGLHETTVPCLESILRQTASVDFEIVVVDNASSDGTPDYLRQAAERSPRIRPILNKTNRGFAGGNNLGIRAAHGTYLVLLNSDTRVTEGWLDKLLAPLRKDATIGLIGPVSNEVGNEQRIFTKGISPEEITAEGKRWCDASIGDMFLTNRLGFFCVALPREVFAKVGPLDESFGLGFYEDDDYCIRVQQAGYRLVCREDVFIYHKGSATFPRMSEETHTLMKRNKRHLEKKHGIKYRPAHPRDRQMDLIRHSLREAMSEGLTTGLSYMINNRLCLAEGMMPRGFWKRWKFRRSLASLRQAYEAALGSEKSQSREKQSD
jgi:GT2 family glycosyltransferase